MIKWQFSWVLWYLIFKHRFTETRKEKSLLDYIKSIILGVGWLLNKLLDSYALIGPTFQGPLIAYFSDKLFG